MFEGVVYRGRKTRSVSRLPVEPPAQTEEQKWGFLMLA